jgi:hypothetical protein
LSPAQTDHAPKREIGEPLKLAYLFVEKRTGRPAPSVAFVNSKDVQTAKEMLTEIEFEEASAFLDFALAAARETNFDVQTLGGLRQYLARYKASQANQATAKEQKEVERRCEDERLSYDSYRRREAAGIFETLPDGERQEIEVLARQAATGFGGSLADAMFRTKLHQITATRHGGRIKSFEHWKAAA